MAYIPQQNARVYQRIIKNKIKGSDDQLDAMVHRVRSGKVLLAGAFVLQTWDGPSSWRGDALTNLEALKTRILGFLWRLHHVSISSYG